MRLLRLMLLSASLLFFVPAMVAPALAQTAPAADPATWKTIDERWYMLEIGGARAGWMSSIVDQDKDQFRTSTSMNMKVGRGPAAVEITIESSATETADGKPVSLAYTENMATQSKRIRYDFHDDHVLQSSEQGGREATKKLPLPEGEWFMPHAADKYARQQRKSGAETITYRTLDPQTGIQPIKSTSKCGETTQYDAGDGRTIPVTIWKTITDILPIEATEYFDAEGVAVYQEVPTGIGKIVMRQTTKALARAEGDGPGPELLARSFVKPDKPIERPQETRRIKLRLIARAGDLPELASAGAQRVEMSADKKSAVITIDVENPVPAESEDASNPEYREASSTLDCDDERVQELAERAAGDEDDVAAKAEALRKLTLKHISKKGLATAFASASETARTKTGDCSEHGVLLTALLRAQGIPSRVATGLVYVDQFMGEKGIYGWHMWSQALIDGKWIDLDPTMPKTFSAAHILTSVSSLADGGGMQDLASVMQLMGNVDVEVLEVEH